MRFQHVFQSRLWGLVACVFLGACAGVPVRDVPPQYGSLDSATSSCRQNPALCARVAGEEVVVPQAAQRIAEAGISVAAVAMSLESELRVRIEKALTECADDARSQVLIDQWGGRSPGAEDCTKLAPGRDVTLAVFLGEQMHKAAFKCAEERLGQLHPDGFSFEPRYRYDRKTGKTTLISEQEAQTLLRQWRGDELKGTLRPDVVIHSGNPLRVEVVYDFKFPCVSDEDPTPWSRYPEGHPHEGFSQKAMYEEALRAQAWRVVPRWGILP